MAYKVDKSSVSTTFWSKQKDENKNDEKSHPNNPGSCSNIPTTNYKECYNFYGYQRFIYKLFFVFFGSTHLWSGV